MNKLTRYKDIESFLFSQLPMFQRIGAKAFKTDLVNIQKLLEYFNNPEKELKCIHIAGTNGKGSTSYFIATALSTMGYKVGLYTSPHYKDYRERIKVDASMIPKKYVKEFVNKMIEGQLFSGDFKPSFFEVTVAMAFCYFRDQKIDYAVIETGLGGRLDSTNVIHPILSVITNIGFDHMAFLGNTLSLIAGEKAGIIKSHIPVVIGKTQEDTKQVFIEKANSVSSEITFADQQMNVKIVEDISKQFPSYQRENLYTAFYSLSKIFPSNKWYSDLTKAWSSELKRWGFMGRYTVLSLNPKTLADSAHNEQGMEVLMAQIKQEKFDQLHIVMAVVNDKDLDKVFYLLPRGAKYYFSNANIPRALDKEELLRQAQKRALQGKTYNSVKRALAAARRTANPDDLILVTGSIFTVAEIIELGI